ncbi:hypothetical protein O6H91_19G001500 [Diphasiastrum complanatum]|uniref:Uncharacterized protein n=1 Tax=Diphasiastrum complanatum TaxID=34168 RepID=A0ACC2AS05_DIPCM|nr:hypothetical protein O6H91_19G001500 [Diphasiastrum complanatum]
MFLPRSLQLRLLNTVDADAVEEEECTRMLASLVADYFRKRGLNKTLARFVKESRLKDEWVAESADLQAIYSSYKGSKSSGSSKKRKKKKLSEDEKFETELEQGDTRIPVVSEIDDAVSKNIKLYESTLGRDKKGRKKNTMSILTNGSSCVMVDTVEAGKGQELQTSMRENGVLGFFNSEGLELLTSLPNGDFRDFSKNCQKQSQAKKQTLKGCLKGRLSSPVDTGYSSFEHFLKGKKSKRSKSDDCVPSKGFQVEPERRNDFSEKQAAEENTWSCRKCKTGERGELIFKKDK